MSLHFGHFMGCLPRIEEFTLNLIIGFLWCIRDYIPAGIACTRLLAAFVPIIETFAICACPEFCEIIPLVKAFQAS
jgi:hypothetical protein